MGGRRAVMRRVLAAVAVGAVLTGLTAAGLAAGVLAGFQQRALDQFFPVGPADPRVVVVGIDSGSIDRVGQGWPWPRDVHADLVMKLTEAGAEVIVYDIVFDAETPHDAALATAMDAHGAVVLAEGIEVGADTASGVPSVVTRVGSTSQLTGAAAAVGHAAVQRDADDVVRQVPAVVETADAQFLPALTLAAAAVAADQPAIPTVRPAGVQIGTSLYPTDDGRLRVAFTDELQRRGVAVESAQDVLSGGQDLRGAIAVVGATELLSGDVHDVPKYGTQPGVFVHANALSTVLTGTPVGQPTTAGTLLAAFVLALVVGYASRIVPLAGVPVGAVIGIGVYVALASSAFDAGRALDVVFPSLAAALAAVAAVALRYGEANRGQRRLATLFSEYVPAPVARELVERGVVQEALDGQRLELTVLFCDLRGFTPLAAELEPAQIRDVLNVYYDVVGGLVLEHGGTLMQYVGDEVYGVFGAPLEQPHHARQAAACAIAIRDAAAAINQRLDEQKLPAIGYGIGVNSGVGVAAHCGGASRRQYTVVGHVVNVGSRVCGAAPVGEVVITDTVQSALDGEAQTEPLGHVSLKGVAQPLTLHRLVATAAQPANHTASA